jgi:hypothetical protein
LTPRLRLNTPVKPSGAAAPCPCALPMARCYRLRGGRGRLVPPPRHAEHPSPVPSRLWAVRAGRSRGGPKGSSSPRSELGGLCASWGRASRQRPRPIHLVTGMVGRVGPAHGLPVGLQT